MLSGPSARAGEQTSPGAQRWPRRPRGGSHLAGVLLALGVAGTHQASRDDGLVVVVTRAVAELSADDGHGDLAQGVRGAQAFWIGGAPAGHPALRSLSEVVPGARLEQLDVLAELCGRVKLPEGREKAPSPSARGVCWRPAGGVCGPVWAPLPGLPWWSPAAALGCSGGALARPAQAQRAGPRPTDGSLGIHPPGLGGWAASRRRGPGARPRPRVTRRRSRKSLAGSGG